jgi:HSP20 family protein
MNNASCCTPNSAKASREISPLGRVISQIWNDPFFGEFRTLSNVGSAGEGVLPIDISEDDSAVYVRASLPGFKKENIEVEVHEGLLSIKASHAQDQEQRTERFYRQERRVGTVSRSISLPSTVEEAEIQAELKDGVLTLRLPKQVQAMPRKVSIG